MTDKKAKRFLFFWWVAAPVVRGFSLAPYPVSLGDLKRSHYLGGGEFPSWPPSPGGRQTIPHLSLPWREGVRGRGIYNQMKKKRGHRAVLSSNSVLGGQLGMTLLEVLVALAILAAVAGVFLIGLSTSSKGVMTSQKSVTAESLVKSQMESIKSWTYDDVHNPPEYEAAKLADIPAGYDIAIGAVRLDPKGDGTGNDDGLQQITVTVTRNGEEVITTTGYKRKPPGE